MRELLWVALGGAVGSVGRYLVGIWAARYTAMHQGLFPLGTLVVNVVGGLVLGLLVALVVGEERLPHATRLALGTGFCGAFTTFSTFSVETLRLAQQGELGVAAANVGLNLALGLGGAALGLALGRLLAGA